MSAQTFNAFIRRAAGAVSRRTSLLALGATALTAALDQDGTAAADCSGAVRRCKDKCRKKMERKCTAQRTQCVNVANEFCNGDLGCLASISPCCRMFGSHCNATAALECLVSIN